MRHPGQGAPETSKFMPEGHLIHRLAKAFHDRFVGRVIHASSPQGRFNTGAAALDGLRMVSAEAHGKHLFLCFKNDGALDASSRPVWLRVHLGLYGGWRFAEPSLKEQERVKAAAVGGASKSELCSTANGADQTASDKSPILADPVVGLTKVPEASAVAASLVVNHQSEMDVLADDGNTGATWPPEPRGLVRLRLLAGDRIADLSGPTACVLETPEGKKAAMMRLGEDPLRDDADCDAAGRAVRASRSAIGLLLMRQDLIAGIGNIYRAEVLFRAGIDPYRPGRDLTEAQWLALWTDLRGLMQDGVEQGRIVTTRSEHRVSGQCGGVVKRGDASYVAHRAGQPCRVCHTLVRAETMAGRTLYWCEVCQPCANLAEPGC